jgi:hypothetical protein
VRVASSRGAAPIAKLPRRLVVKLGSVGGAGSLIRWRTGEFGQFEVGLCAAAVSAAAATSKTAAIMVLQNRTLARMRAHSHRRG